MEFFKLGAGVDGVNKGCYIRILDFKLEKLDVISITGRNIPFNDLFGIPAWLSSLSGIGVDSTTYTFHLEIL